MEDEITGRLQAEKVKVDKVAEKQKAVAMNVLKPAAEVDKVAQKQKALCLRRLVSLLLGLKLELNLQQRLRFSLPFFSRGRFSHRFPFFQAS